MSARARFGAAIGLAIAALSAGPFARETRADEPLAPAASSAPVAASTATEPDAATRAPPASSSAAPAATSTPAPLVLILDDTGLHPADASALESVGKKKKRPSPAERGVAAARIGLPPRRDAEPMPARLDWEPGEVVPFGYQPTTGPNRRLRDAGIATFSSSAGLSLLVGLIDLAAGGGLVPLAIPVAGPVIAMGTSESEGSATYVLALDSLVQATGVALFVLAWFDEDSYLTRTAPRPAARLLASPTSAGLEVQF
jgi:hypothetical protein